MFRDPDKLQVFHLAHRLALDVYRLTQWLPRNERYELGSQLRRAAVSIPSNIVEGCARASSREYRRFLEVAGASAVEVRYLLRLVIELELLSGEAVGDCSECSDHVVRALLNLQRSVKALNPGPAMGPAPAAQAPRS